MKTLFQLRKYSPKSIGFYQLDVLPDHFECRYEAERERLKLETVLKKIDGRYSVSISTITVGEEDLNYVI